jgi:hypothetical protein
MILTQFRKSSLKSIAVYFHFVFAFGRLQSSQPKALQSLFAHLSHPTPTTQTASETPIETQCDTMTQKSLKMQKVHKIAN